MKFLPDSLEYRVLSEWIAAGTPPPRADEAEDRRAGRPSPRRPARAGRAPAGPRPGQVLRRPGRGRDPLGQVREHRRHRRQGRRGGPREGRRARRGRRHGLVRQPRAALDRQRPVRDGHRSPGLCVGAPEQPDRREEPGQAPGASHPAVARRGRRGLPPPRVPRRDRDAPPRRPGRRLPRRQGPRQAVEAGSISCWRAPSTSITGPTSGRTSSSSRRTSSRRRRCGRSTASCAGAWPRTSPGTSSPARS